MKPFILGPAAYFYVGENSRLPNGQGGSRIRDEKGSKEVLKKYNNRGISS